MSGKEAAQIKNAAVNAKNISSTINTSQNISTAIIVAISIIAIIMFILSFVNTAKFVGRKDDWNQIQSEVTKILIYTVIGTICFTIASLIFYTQQKDSNIMYFVIPVSCMALGLSYSALAVSAISR